MGSLVRRIASAPQAGYGINILETTPPGNISGVKSNVCGIVGDFPWGPTNEITRITSSAELFSTFCPDVFGKTDQYAAMKAFLGKSFPGGIRVARIAAGSQATAAHTFVDAAGSPANSVVATAAYPGLLGNSIQVAWSVNADDSTARDATVTIGTSYSVKYKKVATIVSSALVVTDPGDPYVSFAKAGSATLVPAVISATALSGGSDGTAVALDYVGSSSAAKGIRLFYAETDAASVGVLFVAECPSALCDAVNTGLTDYASEVQRGMVALCTPADLSTADAIAYPADYRTDRAVFSWPRVMTADRYASDLAPVEVDGNAFAAAAILSVDPEVSPGGASGKDYLTGISGLEVETLSRTDYDDLKAAGISAFFLSSSLGTILYGGVTTSTTTGKLQIFRRRMADYIENSIAVFSERFVSLPLDLNLSAQTLGSNSGALIAAITNFLGGLKTTTRIQDYSVDAFSGNLQADLDDGTWTILMSIKLFSAMDAIILKAAIGESVTISTT